MKYRNDFVTNSSSSSFIIAFKDFPKVPEELLKDYPYLKACQDYMEDLLTSSDDMYCESGESTIIYNLTELDKYFIRNYDYNYYYDYENDTEKHSSLKEILDGNDGAKEIYEKCVRYINDGYRILTKEIDYSDYKRKEVIKSLTYSDGIDFHAIQADFNNW